MDEEDKWAIALEKNVELLFWNGGNDAKNLVVNGSGVRKDHKKVIVIGDIFGASDQGSTDIFDCETEQTEKGPAVFSMRLGAAVSNLPSGDVAVFGGYANNSTSEPVSHCERFKVADYSFSDIGYMNYRRHRAAAVLLRNGLVLIISGGCGTKILKSCELYDSVSNKFSMSAAVLKRERCGHTASALPDGRVIVCGGTGRPRFVTETEIYDPTTDSFSDGPIMIFGHSYHAAITLPNGNILILDGTEYEYPHSEVYDWQKNEFSVESRIASSESGHFAAMLPTGKILIGGGVSDEVKAVSSNLYDPQSNSYKQSVTLTTNKIYAFACQY